MKASSEKGGRCSAIDDALDLFVARYDAADEAYQDIADRNRERKMSGGQSTLRDLIAEERAFERLVAARHGLLGALQRAYPTIH